MNKIEKVCESNEYKDRLAGWKMFRIYIPKCIGCGKEKTSYTLWGTRQDAERFASDPSHDCCDKCS